MVDEAAKGLVSVGSGHSVDEVVARLTGLLEAKGITLFAVVDHGGEAAKVGLAMRPTKLVIFGDPRAGTPLMLAAPTSAIDLPLKLLVWEDADGGTRVTYNSVEWLAGRHEIPEELMKNVGGVRVLAEKAAE